MFLIFNIGNIFKLVMLFVMLIVSLITIKGFDLGKNLEKSVKLLKCAVSLEEKKKCIVDGGWSLWNAWGSCVGECGQVGRRIRYRICNNPLPENGANCVGAKEQLKQCSLPACSLEEYDNLLVNDSIRYSQLKVLLEFNNTFPAIVTKCLALHCPFDTITNILSESAVKFWSALLCVKLNTGCPVLGGWSSWGEWSHCSSRCGPGKKIQCRVCNSPVPSTSEYKCKGENCIYETCLGTDCYKGPPQGGKWSEWNPWSKCSTTCGFGIQRRYRVCSTKFKSKRHTVPPKAKTKVTKHAYINSYHYNRNDYYDDDLIYNEKNYNNMAELVSREKNYRKANVIGKEHEHSKNMQESNDKKSNHNNKKHFKDKTNKSEPVKKNNKTLTEEKVNSSNVKDNSGALKVTVTDEINTFFDVKVTDPLSIYNSVTKNKLHMTTNKLPTKSGNDAGFTKINSVTTLKTKHFKTTELKWHDILTYPSKMLKDNSKLNKEELFPNTVTSAKYNNRNKINTHFKLFTEEQSTLATNKMNPETTSNKTLAIENQNIKEPVDVENAYTASQFMPRDLTTVKEFLLPKLEPSKILPKNILPLSENKNSSEGLSVESENSTNRLEGLSTIKTLFSVGESLTNTPAVSNTIMKNSLVLSKNTIPADTFVLKTTNSTTVTKLLPVELKTSKILEENIKISSENSAATESVNENLAATVRHSDKFEISKFLEKNVTVSSDNADPAEKLPVIAENLPSNTESLPVKLKSTQMVTKDMLLQTEKSMMLVNSTPDTTYSKNREEGVQATTEKSISSTLPTIKKIYKNIPVSENLIQNLPIKSDNSVIPTSILMATLENGVNSTICLPATVEDLISTATSSSVTSENSITSIDASPVSTEYLSSTECNPTENEISSKCESIEAEKTIQSEETMTVVTDKSTEPTGFISDTSTAEALSVTQEGSQSTSETECTTATTVTLVEDCTSTIVCLPGSKENKVNTTENSSPTGTENNKSVFEQNFTSYKFTDSTIPSTPEKNTTTLMMSSPKISENTTTDWISTMCKFTSPKPRTMKPVENIDDDDNPETVHFPHYNDSFEQQDCTGPFEEFRQCQIMPCDVNGQWSSWSPWSDCSAECGVGNQISCRSCNNPSPTASGSICLGSITIKKHCYMKPCPDVLQNVAYFEETKKLFFPKNENVMHLLHMYMRFRPYKPTGYLIVRQENICEIDCVKVELFLQGGYLVLKANVHDCITTLVSRNTLPVGEWHDVVATITGNHVSVRIDNSFIPLTDTLSCTPVYPNYDLPMIVGTGLLGEIDRVIINFLPVSLNKKKDCQIPVNVQWPGRFPEDDASILFKPTEDEEESYQSLEEYIKAPCFSSHLKWKIELAVKPVETDGLILLMQGDGDADYLLITLEQNRVRLRVKIGAESAESVDSITVVTNDWMLLEINKKENDSISISVNGDLRQTVPFPESNEDDQFTIRCVGGLLFGDVPLSVKARILADHLHYFPTLSVKGILGFLAIDSEIQDVKYLPGRISSDTLNQQFTDNYIFSSRTASKSGMYEGMEIIQGETVSFMCLYNIDNPDSEVNLYSKDRNINGPFPFWMKFDQLVEKAFENNSGLVYNIFDNGRITRLTISSYKSINAIEGFYSCWVQSSNTKITGINLITYGLTVIDPELYFKSWQMEFLNFLGVLTLVHVIVIILWLIFEGFVDFKKGSGFYRCAKLSPESKKREVLKMISSKVGMQLLGSEFIIEQARERYLEKISMVEELQLNPIDDKLNVTDSEKAKTDDEDEPLLTVYHATDKQPNLRQFYQTKSEYRTKENNKLKQQKFQKKSNEKEYNSREHIKLKEYKYDTKKNSNPLMSDFDGGNNECDTEEEYLRKISYSPSYINDEGSCNMPLLKQNMRQNLLDDEEVYPRKTLVTKATSKLNNDELELTIKSSSNKKHMQVNTTEDQSIGKITETTAYRKIESKMGNKLNRTSKITNRNY